MSVFVNCNALNIKFLFTIASCNICWHCCRSCIVTYGSASNRANTGCACRNPAQDRQGDYGDLYCRPSAERSSRLLLLKRETVHHHQLRINCYLTALPNRFHSIKTTDSFKEQFKTYLFNHSV